MEVLQPLAVGNIGLPAGNILHMLRVDKIHFEPARFQNLIHRNPIHASGLHCDGTNPALLQPVCQRIQIAGESGEAANGLRVTIGTNSHE